MDPEQPLDIFVESIADFLQALVIQFSPHRKKNPEVNEKLKELAPVVDKIKEKQDELQTMVLSVSSKQLRRTIANELCQNFHSHMQQFYARIYKNDKRIVDEIKHELFIKLEFARLFHAADERAHLAIFEHLKTICNYASAHCMTAQMPQTMMGKISGVSKHVAQSMQQTGKMDFGMLMRETQSIISSSNPQELMQVGEMVKNGGLGNLNNMMQQFGGVMGGANMQQALGMAAQNVQQQLAGAQPHAQQQQQQQPPALPPSAATQSQFAEMQRQYQARQQGE